MADRQTYSIEEIKDLLLAQIDTVAAHYAPEAPGSYTDKGRYFTLNPGRVDRSVGSFYVNVGPGAQCGKWRDHATGEFGDVLDLIALALNTDLKGAVREARAFLGLVNESPEQRRIRAKAAEDAKRRRQEGVEQERARRARVAKQAHAIWLAAQEDLQNTPVEAYLRDQRGIDLRALPYPPHALRYARDCFYKHIDPETGEVIEARLPAMLGLVHNGRGQVVAVHRTYLALIDGRWSKARVPEAKKVLGTYAGGCIRISSGRGPRGGKGAPLAKARDGERVYIAEGIEDALSVLAVLPEARVLAGISLSNLGAVELPAAITDVTLVADQDDNDGARAALERAIAAHQSAGRRVRIWRNRHGGKDLNDALRAAKGAA